MKLDARQQIALNEKIIRECEMQIAHHEASLLLVPSDCANPEIFVSVACYHIDRLTAQVERLEAENSILEDKMDREVQSRFQFGSV